MYTCLTLQYFLFINALKPSPKYQPYHKELQLVPTILKQIQSKYF